MSELPGTDPYPLAELVVDLDAVDHNVRTLVRVAAPAGVMAIVKADGYNHGMVA
ncbi:MAG: alanine racemase, partial [Corynebacterium sp.]|nr:alanine racemase [Corynebacterium sp.]